MQIVLLLPSCNWNIKMKIYGRNIYICKTSVCLFIFKNFPISLKENLWEGDHLSTRDKWSSPNVPFVRRFLLYINLDQVRQEMWSDLKQASSYFTHLPRFAFPPPVFDLLSCKKSKLEGREGNEASYNSPLLSGGEDILSVNSFNTSLLESTAVYKWNTHCKIMLLNYHTSVYTHCTLYI